MAETRDQAAGAASMPGFDMDAHKKRAAAAWSVRDQWQQVLLDVYDFIAPYRLSNRLVTKSPGNRVDRIFDTTAPLALIRGVGRLQQEGFPPGEPGFVLEPGPAVKAAGLDVDDVAAELEDITAKIQPVFLTGMWDAALNECLIDTYISTGAMMVLEGDDDCPVRFVTASLDEIALERGPYNTTIGIFFKRKWSRRNILANWPKGTYDEAFRDSARNNGDEEVEVAQDVVWDDAARRWKLFVYLADARELIWQEESRECPWLTPAYWRLPNQTYGYGPALMSLPTVKSLNKAMEITLKNAALTMAGIFTRIDDGVFNPDTARIEPGAFWAVARNGGPLGPSIAPLPRAGDLQLGNLVLQDLRMQVQAMMLDQQLPPDAQTPRSAAEIVERIKRLAQDHASGFGRLVHEIWLPAVRRAIEILNKKGVLQNGLKIDHLSVKLRVLSPLARAYKAETAQTYLQWLQMCTMAMQDPNAVHLLTPVDVGLAEVGANLGVPAHLINPQKVRDDMQRSIASAVQAALAAQAKAAQAPPPPNGAPQQGQGGAPQLSLVS